MPEYDNARSYFQGEPFVGRWLDMNRLLVTEPNVTVGRDMHSILFASPHANAKLLLAISCVAIPRLGPEN
jgi:hypothetical protein